MSGLSARVRVARDRFTLDVAVEVAAGEVVAVLGPNGSGKSTLLDVLAGLLLPDHGRVTVDDRVLTDTATGVRLPPARRGVGLLAQDALLFPHLTALANVAFGPRATGARRGRADEVARHWLAEVGAAEFADRKPAALSGGQAQRVALARALAAEPGLLLLDEPFAALDVDATPVLRGVVRRVLAATGRTALLVTHDPLDALALADRVLVLTDGRVVEDGPTRAVLSRPRTAFTARVAGLNLVSGTGDPAGLRTPDGTLVAAAAGPPGEPAVAVFRPADVAVYTSPAQGSPRNVFAAVVAALEPHGDTVRVRAAATPGGPAWVTGLAADLTPAAVADLALEPGTPVHLSVKAAAVAVHPAGTAAAG
ncbi:Molybdenum transport ATP-binding protein ModC [Actinokineospora spheciospongiae]|uniref:Molybdenum transport ATP-binding protein ModC n=1 Tax=Actinokineospora spheciospongiae TaxID=909613 RepID=W7IPT6_9PSEU|nr:ATP-binding cassette domain-containing protein [Actinokineospora spheciospongiae]EWC58737.1 Molybdenum transport ATP-binding protein ModC [Actinokineospora spheciospongiae]